MKLVQTLVVRDEADIVGEQIAYHLNAGVDFVIASDHASEDGTTQILERYVREGHLRLIRVHGEMRETVADAHGPTRLNRARRTGSSTRTPMSSGCLAVAALKDVFTAVPGSVGGIYALSKHFVPRPDRRLAVLRAHDRARFPGGCHQRPDEPVPAAPQGRASSGSRRHDQLRLAHGIEPALGRAPPLAPGRGSDFPYRSLAQWENKGSRRARGDKPLGQYVTALRAKETGRSASQYAQFVVDDLALERGLADGSLTIDFRLRDALRAVGAGTAPWRLSPSLNASVLLASEAVRDADIVRLHRYVDGLAARLVTLERPERRRWSDRLARCVGRDDDGGDAIASSTSSASSPSTRAHVSRRFSW